MPTVTNMTTVRIFNVVSDSMKMRDRHVSLWSVIINLLFLLA